MLKITKLFTVLLLVEAFSGCSSYDILKSESALDLEKSTLLPTQNPLLETEKNEPTIMSLARLAGILKRDKGGCLRVNGDLIIWPYGSTLKDELIYDKEANLIAEIGKNVIFGGGGLSSEENSAEEIKKISDQLPNAQCSDPYFFVNSVM